jgi:hypothetical protein
MKSSSKFRLYYFENHILINILLERFEVLMPLSIKIVVFRDVMLSTLIDRYQHFRGICYLHPQGRHLKSVLQISLIFSISHLATYVVMFERVISDEILTSVWVLVKQFCIEKPAFLGSIILRKVKKLSSP